MNTLLGVRLKQISERGLQELVQDGAAWPSRSVIPEQRQEERV